MSLVNQVYVILDSLDIHLLGIVTHDLLHLHILRMRLIELVLSFLLLDHLQVVSAKVVHLKRFNNNLKFYKIQKLFKLDNSNSRGFGVLGLLC